jgi:hypothetical protein
MSNLEKRYPNGIPISELTPAIMQEMFDEAKLRACRCYSCKTDKERRMSMTLCGLCGNKRCPHATHHDNKCTGSNEPNQKGSRYQHAND